MNTNQLSVGGAGSDSGIGAVVSAGAAAGSDGSAATGAGAGACVGAGAAFLAAAAAAFFAAASGFLVFLIKLRTVSDGCAPLLIQCSIRSSFRVLFCPAFFGSYVPTISINFPSRGLRLSVTTTLKYGRFNAPSLRNLIATAILFFHSRHLRHHLFTFARVLHHLFQ